MPIFCHKYGYWTSEDTEGEGMNGAEITNVL